MSYCGTGNVANYIRALLLDLGRHGPAWAGTNYMASQSLTVRHQEAINVDEINKPIKMRRSPKMYLFSEAGMLFLDEHLSFIF